VSPGDGNHPGRIHTAEVLGSSPAAPTGFPYTKEAKSRRGGRKADRRTKDGRPAGSRAGAPTKGRPARDGGELGGRITYTAVCSQLA